MLAIADRLRQQNITLEAKQPLYSAGLRANRRLFTWPKNRLSGRVIAND